MMRLPSMPPIRQLASQEAAKIRGWMREETAAPGAVVGFFSVFGLQAVFFRSFSPSGFVELWILGTLAAILLALVVWMFDWQLKKKYLDRGWGWVSLSYTSMLSPPDRFIFWSLIYSWGMAFLCLTALWDMTSIYLRIRNCERQKDNKAVNKLIDAAVRDSIDRSA